MMRRFIGVLLFAVCVSSNVYAKREQRQVKKEVEEELVPVNESKTDSIVEEERVMDSMLLSTIDTTLQVVSDDGLPVDFDNKLQRLLNIYHGAVLESDCVTDSIGPVFSDSVYMERLKKIPSVFELVYNPIVKKYIELVNAQKEIDPDFSAKNYEYFLKHNKVKKEIVKPIINSSIFTIDDCDLDDIMPISTSKEEVIKEKVPSIFTQEYIDTYMDKME
jgi:hypothetical protein